MDSILGSVFGPQNGGSFCRQNCDGSPSEKKHKFRLFLHVRDRSFPYRWVSRALQRREYLFSTPCEHLCPHMFLNCSRACADIHACRAWRTIARGAAKSWKPSGMQTLSGDYRFVGKIVVTERKKAQVSIVSSCTRQKFPIPLGFQGFAAPRVLVLHTLRTLMSTHVTGS